MKKIIIDSLSTAYTFSENKDSKKLYVFLHGWGGSQQSFLPIAQKIKHNSLVFDWPGFGESDNPPTDWDTHKYAQFFQKFLAKFSNDQIKEIILYGHSFGCRVITRYMTEQSFDEKISEIFFTGAAGVNLPLPFHKKIIKILAQATKPFKKIIPAQIQSLIRRKIFRAHDWDAVSGVMKKTFSNVIAEPDFRNDLTKITTPSTLIWGQNDTYTPIMAAKIWNQKLPNVKKFHIFPTGRHGIHNTHAAEILEIINH